MMPEPDPRQLAANLLDDAVAALRQVGPDRYRDSGAGLGSSPIGVHYRHVLDHYVAVAHGLAGGHIDYDERARDPRVETDLGYALQVTESCRRAVLAFPEGLLDAPIEVTGFCGATPAVATSTLRRELGYLVCHSIHHFAIIKLVARAHGVPLAPEFGVAPSTLATHPAAQPPR